MLIKSIVLNYKIAIEMAPSCCFSKGGNIENQDFLHKRFMIFIIFIYEFLS